MFIQEHKQKKKGSIHSGTEGGQRGPEARPHSGLYPIPQGSRHQIALPDWGLTVWWRELDEKLLKPAPGGGTCLKEQ